MLLISHSPTKKIQFFGIRGCTDDWHVHRAKGGFRSIEAVLLYASDQLDVPVSSWQLFQPRMGNRLYSTPRTFLERKHSSERRAFARLLEV